AMTRTEKIFWEEVKNSKLGTVVRRQMPILDYVVDFYIKEFGIAIEIDGTSHDNNFMEDARRQGRIEELGVTFIRFTNNQVQTNINGVILELKDFLHDYH
ncbi:MAG: endonuclease domain-containing protein, partial [Maribacter sp.]